MPPREPIADFEAIFTVYCGVDSMGVSPSPVILAPRAKLGDDPYRLGLSAYSCLAEASVPFCEAILLTSPVCRTTLCSEAVLTGSEPDGEERLLGKFIGRR